MSFRNDRLVALRKEKWYKQTSLANALNLSRSTIAMWEAGLSDPTAEYVAKLAGILDCSVGYLMGTEDEINAQRKLDEIRAERDAYMEGKIGALLDRQTTTQQAREELAEDPNRRALLNLAQYGSDQDVKQVAALIDALRATNPDFYDGDDPA